MTPTQPWTLICLRESAKIPEFYDLRARFGEQTGCIVLHEIHPLDAEEHAEGIGANLVLTMSKAFIDVFAAASAEEVRQRLWFADARGRLRQLTVDQAESFWRAWEAGVQHVSEILISHGLWY